MIFLFVFTLIILLIAIFTIDDLVLDNTLASRLKEWLLKHLPKL